MTYDDWLEEPYQDEVEEKEERDPDEYQDEWPTVGQYYIPETKERD